MPEVHLRKRITVRRATARGLLAGLLTLVLFPLMLLALGVALIGTVVGLVGAAVGLGMGCLAVALPLLGLMLWGLWDRVWLGLRIRSAERTFGLRFPVPVSLLRFGGLQVAVGDQSWALRDIPWRELRDALREEPIVIEVDDPEDGTHIHVVIGPRHALGVI